MFGLNVLAIKFATVETYIDSPTRNCNNDTGETKSFQEFPRVSKTSREFPTMSVAAIAPGLIMDAPDDQDILFTELGKLLPRKATYWTLWKWHRVGARSRSGRVVCLKAVQLPHGLGSSPAKYAEFVKELQE
jgi:hypothetical protein